jgi:hypothetical protein
MNGEVTRRLGHQVLGAYALNETHPPLGVYF